MNKKRKFSSLNVQLTMALVLGILMACVMYVVVSTVGDHMISEIYLSDEAVEKSIGEVYESLEKYIVENDVEADDADKILEWLSDMKYTYISVYDNYSTYFAAGWQGGSGYGTPTKRVDSFENILPDVPRLETDNFYEDVKNRIVAFADQEYYVFIDQYKESLWYNMLKIATVIICFITLLASILVYNATVLRRVKIFAQQVSVVADGDLDGEISNIHNDEIGRLATSVDNMRQSIIEKHESEKKAWEANQELITAMSHDIRSPLTSIIGYLDIIKDKQEAGDNDTEKYIEACRDKAFQLKTLSDKMFQYFLVFGNSDENMEFESVDATILFQQILGEHNAELTVKGYTVQSDYHIEEGYVNVDISSLRRVFDNIFTNITKYGDMDKPVITEVFCSDDKINIHVENSIPEIAKKVESTRLGLKTCEKLCINMNASFRYEESQEAFKVFMEFPMEKE